jgi:hypothetical protein
MLGGNRLRDRLQQEIAANLRRVAALDDDPRRKPTLARVRFVEGAP